MLVKILLIFLFFALSFTWAQEDDSRRSIMEQQLDTIRFGTETEIAALIQTLRDERVSYLDNELVGVANITRNRNILTALFNFFAESEKTGLEERAIRAIVDRDYEVNDTVSAAVNYLGRIRAAEAVDTLMELINSGETRFLNTSIRALGRVAQGNQKQNLSSRELNEQMEKVAFFLLDYFNNRNPSEESRNEIVAALGDAGSEVSVPFISDIIRNPDERPFLRMAALTAISKIKAVSEINDEQSINAVIEAVSSSDSNIRSAAVAALGPFTGEDVEDAILEAFRDSFWRTRVGAAQAAGQRRLVRAIPYLRFRAERDDVPQVRDEAIRALGAINNSETVEILETLFMNRRNSDRVRLLAGEMLLQYQADDYAVKIIAEMDDAKVRNQTALYNGFIRFLSNGRSSAFNSFARRLLDEGGVIERSLALDLIMNNQIQGLAENVRPLLDERSHGVSLARKAQRTLEALGLE